MTNRQILEEIKRELREAGIAEAENDARLLFYGITGMSRTDYLLRMEEELDPSFLEALRRASRRRRMREPLQYILGKAYFMGFEFETSPSALIPRYDTEILAEEAIKYVRDGFEVLDMCTGTGCIAISVALLTRARGVIGADISEEALELAEKNRRRLNAGNVSFVKSDMFGAVSGSFDMILSNPPYIKSGDIDGLASEVRDFEPRLALDGHGDGLFFYRILAKESLGHLKRGGYIMTEIGCGQAGEVAALFERYDYADIRVIKDLAGLDRVVCGRRI
ncbi:MAG: peptide chain release factor N(5)-glutamine methyltransferase [Butyrivibrio sp.]|nr:peptide chain release factor N(5)-glutamine methyltransferase [Butyrivibrio sp.]